VIVPTRQSVIGGCPGASTMWTGAENPLEAPQCAPGNDSVA
jgi:hypothetical protein